MKKFFLMALMAVATVCAMTSCEGKEYVDIVTSVSNSGSDAGLEATYELLPMYREAIATAQGGEVSGTYIRLSAQADDTKAKQGATDGANKVKSQLLADGTFTFTDVMGAKQTVKMAEGTAEDSNCKIYVHINTVDGAYITHYYKVTK